MQNRLPILLAIVLLATSTCFGENQETNAQSGDFNQDGRTDGADLERWKAAFDLGGDNASLIADSDNDGDSDGADFLAWQRGYEGYSLPEPSTFVLAVPLLLAMLTKRRRISVHRRYDTPHKPGKMRVRRKRFLADTKQC